MKMNCVSKKWKNTESAQLWEWPNDLLETVEPWEDGDPPVVLDWLAPLGVEAVCRELLQHRVVAGLHTAQSQFPGFFFANPPNTAASVVNPRKWKLINLSFCQIPKADS